MHTFTIKYEHDFYNKNVPNHQKYLKYGKSYIEYKFPIVIQDRKISNFENTVSFLIKTDTTYFYLNLFHIFYLNPVNEINNLYLSYIVH